MRGFAKQKRLIDNRVDLELTFCGSLPGKRDWMREPGVPLPGWREKGTPLQDLASVQKIAIDALALLNYRCYAETMEDEII